MKETTVKCMTKFNHMTKVNNMYVTVKLESMTKWRIMTKVRMTKWRICKNVSVYT